MKTLKVYRFGDGKNELICGAYTKKEAAELFGISLRDLNTYSSITGNAEQVKICTNTPQVCFIKKNFSNEPFKPKKE